MPQKDAVEAWKSTAVGERREVLALAKKGLRHPVPDTAAAAYAWSHRASLDQAWNKAPGWLLPCLGLLLAGVGLALNLVVFLVGGCLLSSPDWRAGTPCRVRGCSGASILRRCPDFPRRTRSSSDGTQRSPGSQTALGSALWLSTASRCVMQRRCELGCV